MENKKISMVVNEEDIRKARYIIQWAIIGIIVILASYTLTYFVVTKVLDTASNSGGASGGSGGADPYALEGGVRGGACQDDIECSEGFECVSDVCISSIVKLCYCYVPDDAVPYYCERAASRDDECESYEECYICN